MGIKEATRPADKATRLHWLLFCPTFRRTQMSARPPMAMKKKATTIGGTLRLTRKSPPRVTPQMNTAPRMKKLKGRTRGVSTLARKKVPRHKIGGYDQCRH